MAINLDKMRQTAANAYSTNYVSNNAGKDDDSKKPTGGKILTQKTKNGGGLNLDKMRETAANAYSTYYDYREPSNAPTLSADEATALLNSVAQNAPQQRRTTTFADRVESLSQNAPKRDNVTATAATAPANIANTPTTKPTFDERIASLSANAPKKRQKSAWESYLSDLEDMDVSQVGVSQQQYQDFLAGKPAQSKIGVGGYTITSMDDYAAKSDEISRKLSDGFAQKGAWWDTSDNQASLAREYQQYLSAVKDYAGSGRMVDEVKRTAAKDMDDAAKALQDAIGLRVTAKGGFFHTPGLNTNILDNPIVKRKIASDDNVKKAVDDATAKLQDAKDRIQSAEALQADKTYRAKSAAKDRLDAEFYDKYGISRDSFGYNDLQQWAADNGMRYTVKAQNGMMMDAPFHSVTEYRHYDPLTPTDKVKEYIDLIDLAETNETRDPGIVNAAVGSLFDAYLLGIPGALSNFIDKTADSKYVTADERASFSERMATHPIAFAAGEIVGDVASRQTIGAIIHNATGGTKALSTETRVLDDATKKAMQETAIKNAAKKRSLETAATFGIRSAISSSVRQDWSDPVKASKAVIGDVFASALGGYLGAEASRVAGNYAYEKLARSGIRLSQRAATAISAGIGASAFSAVSTAIQEGKTASQAFSEGKEYTPNIKQIAVNILAMGIYAALQGYITYDESAYYNTQETNTNNNQQKHQEYTEDEVKRSRESAEEKAYRSYQSNKYKYKYFNGTDDFDTIKRKMRNYVKEYHPDLNPDPEAAKILAEINSEYNEIQSAFAYIARTQMRTAAETNTEPSDEAIKNAVTIINDAVNAESNGNNIPLWLPQTTEAKNDFINQAVADRMTPVRNNKDLTIEDKKEAEKTIRKEETEKLDKIIKAETKKAEENAINVPENVQPVEAEKPAEAEPQIPAQEAPKEVPQEVPKSQEVTAEAPTEEQENAVTAEEQTREIPVRSEETPQNNVPASDKEVTAEEGKQPESNGHRLSQAQMRDLIKTSENGSFMWVEYDGKKYIGNGYALIQANDDDADTLSTNASSISKVEGPEVPKAFSDNNAQDITSVSLFKSKIDGKNRDVYILQTPSGERLLFDKRYVDLLTVNGGRLKTDDSKIELFSYDDDGGINGIVMGIRPTESTKEQIDNNDLKPAKGFTAKDGGIYIDKYQQKTFADVKNKTSLGSYINDHIGEPIYVNGEKRRIGALSRGDLVTIKPDGTRVHATLTGSQIDFGDNSFTVTFDTGVKTVFSFDEPKTKESIEKTPEKEYNETAITEKTSKEATQNAGKSRNTDEIAGQVPDSDRPRNGLHGGRSVRGAEEGGEVRGTIGDDREDRGQEVRNGLQDGGENAPGSGDGLRMGSESGIGEAVDSGLPESDRVQTAGEVVVGNDDNADGRRPVNQTEPAPKETQESEETSKANEEPKTIEEPAVPTEEKEEKKPKAIKKNTNNYRITEDIDSIRPNFDDNLAAIKLLKELQNSGRMPTVEEKAVLARYKGWGGLKQDVLDTGYNTYRTRQLKEILTDDEYEAAKVSTLNAHYTSTKVIDGIYKAIERLGFKGGNILEPSMGVGNFFGRLPAKLSSSSSLYGVELDNITGAIAGYLYPDAQITVDGFQNVLYPDGTFDLAVGNVPFSDMTLEYRGNKYMLHDFFFVKTLDEMKEGGLVAMLTSTGTLDKLSGKVQSEIAKRANLIAAFRLPDNAFKTNAGTEVTTDLIFLQKKGESIPDNGISFTKIGKIGDIPINEYYVDHPNNILGELAREKGMYASERTIVHATPDFEKRFENAIRSLPKDILSEKGEESLTAQEIKANIRGKKERNVFQKTEDGKVRIFDAKNGKTVTLNAEQSKTALDYIEVKDDYLSIIEAEKSGDIGKANQYRKLLNDDYDSFVKAHGTIQKNKRLLSLDDDYIRVSGLEIIEGKEGRKVKTKKSAIFSKPTIAKEAPKTAGSSNDALVISLNNKGKIDFPYMEELTGFSTEKLIADLNDKIIMTPDGDYELILQYVSGNIYDKLDALEGKEGFEKQEELLRKALPPRKDASSIDATLGAPWIDASYINDFATDIFQIRYGRPNIEFSKELGSWKVDKFYTGSTKFSTNRVSPADILEATLNSKGVEVYDKTADGQRVLNKDATTEAQQKQQELKEAFSDWIFKDKERRDYLVDKFNRLFNAYTPMDYKELGKSLDLEISPSSKIKPRDYQKAGVARILFGGNTLLAHGVGTGKTSTMIMAAHMLKKTGVAQKPLFVAPNGKVNDFRNEILDMYPDANILALDKNMLSPSELAHTKAMISTGDYDFIVIYRSAFEKLPVSPQTEAAFIEERIDKLESALREGTEGKRGGSRTRFEKDLIKKLQSEREKVEKLLDNQKSDDVYFEDIGIDSLFVDEAHNYKKVGFATKLQVSGIDSSTNKITTDLYMKENYLRSRGMRVVFGTATPLTNTLSEMYNMTMHLAPEIYDRVGISAFDSFAANFLFIDEQAEIAPDGLTYRMKERVRKFKNPNELIALFRQFADVVRTQEVVKDLPKAEYIDVICEGTDMHKQLLQQFASRSSNMKPGKDNMLLVTNDGKAAGLDLRLVSFMFPESEITSLDLPTSKINRCVNNVLDVYRETTANKGTQFIFLDEGMKEGGKRYSFNLYKDLKDKLIKGGIPEKEIAFIGDYDGEERRGALYDAMNKGNIRVLIGSTAKMGEGVNAQNKAVALHHVSVPYRPDNIEQREGRIIRHGNENKNVKIYRYIQENSFDSYMWQMLERKATGINQALSGGDATNLEELSDFVLSAGEAKAIATGNPLIVEKTEVDSKILQLRSLKRSYQSRLYDAQETIEKEPAKIEKAKKNIESAEKDIALAKEKENEPFSITIGEKSFDKRADAGKELMPILKKAALSPTGKVTPIGEYKGFRLSAVHKYGSTVEEGVYLRLENAGSYETPAGGSEEGNITRISNLVESGLQKAEDGYKFQLNQSQTALEEAKETVKTPFKQEEELNNLLKRQLEINRELGLQNSGVVNFDDVSIEGQEGAGQDDSEENEVSKRIRPKKSEKSNKESDLQEEWKASRDTENESSIQSISSIISNFSERTGLPIHVGNYRGKQIGQYNSKTGSIRTKTANDLPTVAHELGHYLDEKYKLSASEYINEIMELLPEEFKKNYKKDELPGEAIAEFVRRYLTSRDSARADAPNFYDVFREMLGDDLPMVDDFASEVNAYMSADTTARFRSAIVSESDVKKEEKGTIADKINEIKTELYKDLIDSNIGIKNALNEFDKYDESVGTANAYILATNATLAHKRAERLISYRLSDMHGINLGPSFVDRIRPIWKYKDAFNEYLVLKHALEWLEPNDKNVKPKHVFADPTLENTDTIRARIAELEEQYPDFESVSESVYAFIDSVMYEYGVVNGVISKELYHRLRSLYPHYVPFARKILNKKTIYGAKASFTDQGLPFRRAKGSGLEIMEPLEQIVRLTDRIVTGSIYNKTALALADLADETEGFAAIMEKVSPDLLPNSVDITRQKQNLKDELTKYLSQSGGNAEENIGTLSTLIDDIFTDNVMSFTPYSDKRKNIVAIRRNGKTVYYQINDKDVFDSLTSLSPAQFGKAIRLLNTATSYFKGMVTSFNPLFVITNMARDFGTAWYNTDEKNLAKFISEYAVALHEVIHKKGYYKRYIALGGGETSALSTIRGEINYSLRELVAKGEKKNAERIVTLYLMHPLRTIGNAITLPNNWIEQVPRYMEFKRQLKNTDDTETAMYKSSDITTNFGRHGRVRALNVIIPFSNAQLQGIDRMYRSFKDANGRERAARVMKYALTGLILEAIIYFWNNKKEDEKQSFENLSSYMKNNYYTISLGNGRFLKVAKPREEGILSSFTGRLIEYVFGNEDAFYDFGEYVFSQIAPNFLPSDYRSIENAIHSVASNTLIGGFVDVGFNLDYKGDPIVSEYDKYNDKRLVYSGSTSKPAIALGKVMNYEPKKIDYLLKNYTGYFGTVLTSLFPNEPSYIDKSLGFIGRMTADSRYSTDVFNTMYDKANKASGKVDDEILKDGKASAKSLADREVTNVLSTFTSSYRNALRNNLTDNEEKRQALYISQAIIKNYDYAPSEGLKYAMELYEQTGDDRIFLKSVGLKADEQQSRNKVKWEFHLTPEQYLSMQTEFEDAIEDLRLEIKEDKVDPQQKVDYFDKQRKKIMDEIRTNYMNMYGHEVEETE